MALGTRIGRYRLDNLLGEGGPVTMLIRGQERSGHAVARRRDDGSVTVEIALD